MWILKSQLFQILTLSLCALNAFCSGSIDSKNDEYAVNYDKKTLDELFTSIKEINKKLTEIARDTSQLAEEVGNLKEYRKDEDAKISSILDKLNKIDEHFIEVNNENKKALQPLQEFGSALDELKKLEEKQTIILENFNESKLTLNDTTISEIKLSLEESSTSYSSCKEALVYNGHDGIYSLRIPNSDNEYSSFKAYCLKDNQFGSSYWTIIQRRDMNSEHSVDFRRTWEEYKNGFGDPEYDHWLGLDKIFMLTNSARYDLWTKTAYWGVSVGTGNSNFRIDNKDDFKFTFSRESGKNRYIYDCENTQFNTIDRGDTTWVNSEGGGGGFWGPCDTNFNTEILTDGKWPIYKNEPQFNANYTHMAIGQK